MRKDAISRFIAGIIENPTQILQLEVDSLIVLCSADSAGISLERTENSKVTHFEWIATAGECRPFVHAVLPILANPSSTCLERNSPQLVRVPKSFLHAAGLEAPPVTDGLTVPWQAEGVRGTIWIAAHRRRKAFDQDDLEVMTIFARYAALGVTSRERQKAQYRSWAATAAEAMAKSLAQSLNNPLNNLKEIVSNSIRAPAPIDAKTLALELAAPLQELTLLVDELSSPTAKTKRN